MKQSTPRARPYQNTPSAGLALLCVATSLAAFHQTILFPFVQDDWGAIRAFQTHDAAALIGRFFDPRDRFFYRPGGQTYLLILHRLFGQWAFPFHLLSLCLHIANSYMVHRIVRELTHDRSIALLSSLIYSSAVAIHLDPLCWAVGIYDVGGAFFFLVSIGLFLSGRVFSSALCFLAGSLFKESTVMLPAVLASIAVARVPKWDMREVQSLARRLIPHCVVLALVLGVKLSVGRSPLAMPPSHPYSLALLGSHVFDNAYRYCGWMLQSFIPIGRIQSELFRFLLSGLALLAAVVLILRDSGRTRRLLAGLLLWMVFALLPVVFLPNHTYRYYATYALPAFICAVLILGREFLKLIGMQRRRELVLAVSATLVILASVVQSHRVFQQGLEQRTLADGTNGLVRRARFVNIVRPSLLRQLPPPVDEAVILLRGIDLWSFNKDSGPQVWYRSGRVRVYDLADLRWAPEGLCIENPMESQTEVYTGSRMQRIHLDPQKLHAFSLSHGQLEAVARSQLESIARRQTGAAGGTATGNGGAESSSEPSR